MAQVKLKHESKGNQFFQLYTRGNKGNLFFERNQGSAGLNFSEYLGSDLVYNIGTD